MDEALEGITDNPQSEGDSWRLIPTHEENSNGDNNEGEIPDEVEGGDGARVGPITLPLLDLLGGGFSNPGRWFAHASAGGASEEPGGVAEGRRTTREAASADDLIGEKRRRRSIVGG